MVATTSDEHASFMLDEITLKYGNTVNDLYAYIEKEDVHAVSKVKSDVYYHQMHETIQSHPAVSYILGDLIKLIGIEEALNYQGNKIISTNPTLQRIILKVLSLQLEDHVHTKDISPAGVSFSDYQKFYNDYLTSIKGLERRISDNGTPLPNLAGSLVMAYDKATPLVKTVVPIPKFSSNVESWRTKAASYYKEFSVQPAMSPRDFANAAPFASPAERIQTSFLKIIPQGIRG